MATVSQRAQTVVFERQERLVMPPVERVRHFGTVYRAADLLKLFSEQARRCCQCSEQACTSHDVTHPERGGCPLDNPIAKMLAEVSQPPVVKRAREVMMRRLGGNLDRLISSDELDDIIWEIAKDGAARNHLHEVFRLDLQTNSFPEVLGDYLCPKDVLCEGGGRKLIGGKRVIVESCNAGLNGGKPQIIGGTEGMIGRIGRVLGWLQEDLIQPKEKIDKTVSIIGAGLAGMESAIRLKNHGFQVTMYFKEDDGMLGGVARHNIVGFKLDPDILPTYVECFRAAGIEMVSNTTVDAAMLQEIRSKSYKTIVATGAQTPNTLEVEGIDAKGVVQAMPFLHAVIRKENWGDTNVDGTEPGGIYNGAGKKVVVIGGGDTSIDVVRALHPSGCRGNPCLPRRRSSCFI
jgi:NADPH-dependent glutamate synthase beta subunit-like oxidoreductase